MMLRAAIWIGLLVLVLWVLSGVAVKAQTLAAGVTCADVRKLTAIERWYWRKRLGLTDEQVAAIRKKCGIR